MLFDNTITIKNQEKGSPMSTLTAVVEPPPPQGSGGLNLWFTEEDCTLHWTSETAIRYIAFRVHYPSGDAFNHEAIEPEMTGDYSLRKTIADFLEVLYEDMHPAKARNGHQGTMPSSFRFEVGLIPALFHAKNADEQDRPDRERDPERNDFRSITRWIPISVCPRDWGYDNIVDIPVQNGSKPPTDTTLTKQEQPGSQATTKDTETMNETPQKMALRVTFDPEAESGTLVMSGLPPETYDIVMRLKQGENLVSAPCTPLKTSGSIKDGIFRMQNVLDAMRPFPGHLAADQSYCLTVVVQATGYESWSVDTTFSIPTPHKAVAESAAKPEARRELKLTLEQEGLRIHGFPLDARAISIIGTDITDPQNETVASTGFSLKQEDIHPDTDTPADEPPRMTIFDPFHRVEFFPLVEGHRYRLDVSVHIKNGSALSGQLDLTFEQLKAALESGTGSTPADDNVRAQLIREIDMTARDIGALAPILTQIHETSPHPHTGVTEFVRELLAQTYVIDVDELESDADNKALEKTLVRLTRMKFTALGAIKQLHQSNTEEMGRLQNIIKGVENKKMLLDEELRFVTTDANQLRKDLDAAKQETKDLQEQVQHEKAELEAKSAQADRANTQLTQNNRILSHKINELSSQLQTRVGERDELTRQLDDARAQAGSLQQKASEAAAREKAAKDALAQAHAAAATAPSLPPPPTPPPPQPPQPPTSAPASGSRRQRWKWWYLLILFAIVAIVVLAIYSIHQNRWLLAETRGYMAPSPSWPKQDCHVAPGGVPHSGAYRQWTPRGHPVLPPPMMQSVTNQVTGISGDGNSGNNVNIGGYQIFYPPCTNTIVITVPQPPTATPAVAPAPACPPPTAPASHEPLPPKKQCDDESCEGCDRSSSVDHDDRPPGIPDYAVKDTDGSWGWKITLQPGEQCRYVVDPELIFSYRWYAVEGTLYPERCKHGKWYPLSDAYTVGSNEAYRFTLSHETSSVATLHFKVKRREH